MGDRRVEGCTSVEQNRRLLDDCHPHDTALALHESGL
jgi:hypothetical protein